MVSTFKVSVSTEWGCDPDVERDFTWFSTQESTICQQSKTRVLSDEQHSTTDTLCMLPFLCLIN